MTLEEFEVFMGFCLLFLFFVGLLKIQEFTTPKYLLIKDCKDEGFEIRKDRKAVYHHILDEEKYRAYINRRHQEHLEQFRKDRAGDE